MGNKHMQETEYEQVIAANEEMRRLLTIGEIGAVYIDSSLCLYKFTPIIGSISNLTAADLGRHIDQLTFLDTYPDFQNDIRYVRESGNIAEREITNGEGSVWLFRLRPHQKDHGETGVLILGFDITKHLEAARTELEILTDNIPGGVVKLQYEPDSLILLYANSGFYLLSGLTVEEYHNRYGDNYYNIINKADWPALRRAIELAVITGETFQGIYRVFPEKGDYYREIRGKAVQNEEGQVILQCNIYDITEAQRVKMQLELANRKYTVLLDNLDGGIVHLAYDCVTDSVSLPYVSDGLLRMLGLTWDEYEQIAGSGRQIELIHPDDRGLIMENIRRRLGKGEDCFQYYRLLQKNGNSIWIQASGSILQRKERETVMQYIVTDITLLKNTQKELEREKEQVEAIASLSANILFRYDIENETVTSLLTKGVYFPEQMKENYEDFIYDSDYIFPEDMGIFRRFFDDFRTKPGVNHAEFRRKFEDGSYRWVAADCKTLCDEQGRPYLAVGKYTDIEEIKQKENKLLEESRIDSLTGLCQRNYFREKSEAYIRAMGSEKAAFLLIDIDDFKDINDTYGHLFGDSVLQNVGEGILEIRDHDLIAGRFGGDEFMVLVKDIRNLEEILHISRDVSDVLKNKYYKNIVTNSITFSMGIALIPDDGTEFHELFSKADYTLYRTKQMGKNLTRLFNDFHSEYEKLEISHGRFKTYEEELESTRLNLSEELVEYLISILGGIDDFTEALSIVMANIGRKFDLSYITLRWAEEDTCRFVLEQYWKRSDKYPSLNSVHQYSRQEYRGFLSNFDSDGVYICEDCNESKPENYMDKWGAQVGVRATLQCLVHDRDQVVGIMTFSYSENERQWSAREIKMLKMITRVLSLHISSNKSFMEIEQKVDKMTHFDKITGLYNYNKFKEEANLLLKQHDKDKNLALVYSDFTNFKHINDAFGFETGDQILKEFADFIVADNPTAVIGAREYADNIVVLVDIPGNTTLEEVVGYYNEAFCSKQNERYPGLNMVISSGGYILDAMDENIVTAIDNANIARKLTKEKKKGGFLYFEPQMLTSINRQTKILSDFSGALKNCEFQMYLQPQVDIITGEAIGAEALVRWKKKDGNSIYPDDFIPVLEKNGNIVELDFYMLDCALRTLQSWKRKGLKMIPISVNFSRVHFYSGNLITRLMQRIHDFDIDPAYIDIEITEGMFVENYGRLAEDIVNLRKEGFSISIDDFGTGYSSLSILTNLKVQAIKIDKSFLYGAEKSDAQKNVIEYMFSLAKELDLGVVCEGAETEKQIKFLLDVGCKVVQGYYFDKPLPQQDFCRKYICPDYQ